MTAYPEQSPISVGLACKCPRCGRGALFGGFLTLKTECDHCGLAFDNADAGDGPAVFIMFIVGFIAVAMAVLARSVLYAPIWAAFLVSAIIGVALILVLIRPLKATFIALQYQHNAREARNRG